MAAAAGGVVVVVVVVHLLWLRARDKVLHVGGEGHMVLECVLALPVLWSVQSVNMRKGRRRMGWDGNGRQAEAPLLPGHWVGPA